MAGLEIGIFQILLNLREETALDLSNTIDQVNMTRGKNFGNGTGANQADTIWHDNRTLADGADETLDIFDGSLTKADGVALTMSKLKGIYIRNNSTDANLEIGGAAATQLGLFADVSDILSLPPGGDFLMTAPDANGIDCTTNAHLKIAHDGTGRRSHSPTSPTAAATARWTRKLGCDWKTCTNPSAANLKPLKKLLR